MESNDILHQWATKFINETDYQRYINPIIESQQRLSEKDLKFLYELLRNATEPTKELLDPCFINSYESIFEKFLKKLYDKTMPTKLFVKLINFIPQNRTTAFICSFLNSLEFFDLIRIVPYFPQNSKAKPIGYCKLLSNEKTFLSAFSFLIQNYNFLSYDLKLFFNKCFRHSLSKGICTNLLKDMIHVGLEFAPVSIDNNNESLDMFFSALTDNMEILNSLCHIKNFNYLFEDSEIRNDLPQTFLKFLNCTSLNYNFTTDQLFSFINYSPAFFFKYVNNLDDNYNETMWIQILSIAISFEFGVKPYEFHRNIFLSFLLCILQRPNLVSLFHDIQIAKLFKFFFNVKASTIIRNPSLISIIIIFLAYSRIDENFTSELFELSNVSLLESFPKSNSNTNLALEYQTDESIDQVMYANSCTNLTKELSIRDLISIIIDQNDELVEDAFLWLFSPTSPFPVEGTMKLESESILSDFPYPSFAFITEIAPSILRPMIRSKSRRTLSKILNALKFSENAVLFKELSSPDLLRPFLEKALKDPLYFDLITAGLSISCDFSIFSPLFYSICTDIEKTIHFLTVLSKQTLFVDDYLYINNEFFLSNTPVMSGTICLWIRTHSKNAKIFTVTSPEIKIIVSHEFNDFTLYVSYFDKEKEPKSSSKLTNVESVNGWYFLSFSLTPKSITFSVNLESVSLMVNAGVKATMSIGSKAGMFDLQSLRIQRPTISQEQNIHLFALGPNYKEAIIPDFFTIKHQQPHFVSSNSYVSNLYIKWANVINESSGMTKSSSESLKTIEELSISPPFKKKSASRKSAFSQLKSDGSEAILDNHLYFTSFLNSFDAQGGISFLIHIWAEVLLNKVKTNTQVEIEDENDQLIDSDKIKIPNYCLVKKMFDLISILLNKFPSFHYFFVQNSVYCLIGQLMKQSPYDALPRAINRENNLITNMYIIKYWVLGPLLNKSEFPDSIKVLIDIAHEPQNQHLLSQANCFFILIRHISLDSNHTPEFMKLLSNLAMSITTDETCLENATFLFNILIVRHLQFSIQNPHHGEQTNEDEEKILNLRSLTLVRLMNSMLESYPELATKLNIELMIPAIIPTTVYQSELVDLLINYLDEKMLYVFSIVLMSIQATPVLSENIYKATSARLSDKNEHVKKLHTIILPLVYFASHLQCTKGKFDHQEDFFALCSTASFILDSFKTPYPPFIYEELIQIIGSLEELNDSKIESESANCDGNGSIKDIFILPNVITKDFFEEKSQTTSSMPFVSLLATVLPRALLNNDIANVEKFFISIFTLQKLPIYRQKGITLFIIGKMFEKLTDTYKMMSLNQNNEIFTNSDPNIINLVKDGQIETFIKSCLSIGSIAFQKIQLIPGDKTESLSLICCFFLKQVFLFGEIIDSSDVFNAEIQTLVDFSSLNSISSLIIPHIINLPKLSKNKKFSKTIDRLRNPTCYPPIKISQPKLEKKLEALVSKCQKQDALNESGLLTIICNTLQYQTICASKINFFDANEEKIIKKWHKVFNTLYFPSSRIFENCPNKYTVNDKACFERRRTLLPINPSSDTIYTSFYEEKYQSPLPQIRLTLSEVLENSSLGVYHGNDIIFSGDAVILTGISLLKGVLVILSDQLKFYQDKNKDVISFKFKDIIAIQLVDYMHQPRGIRVENRSEDTYLFAFEAQSIRDCFVELCESLKKFPLIKEIEKIKLEELTNQWRDGLISNFDYLLKLNLLSGRTWADFTQFPVFPWTLNDFRSKTIDIENPIFYRNLEYPLFAQTDLQKKAIQQYYETIGDVSTPHHFPKYISNVGSTLYFLVRLEPFTNAELDFQGGKLDCADRTFHSFMITYDLMTAPGSKSSLELVPEVYFFPEMLENINGVSFGNKKLNDGDEMSEFSEFTSNDINNVFLPPWCKSPNEFVDKMRDALESNIVSQSLNEWIDLIWGFRRKGKGSLERLNVLQEIVFDFNPEEYIDDYSMMKAMSETIHNCGQAPSQLFDSPHPKKRYLNSMKKLKLVPNVKMADDGNYFINKPFGGTKIVIDKNDSIVIYKNKVVVASYRFSNEIRPVAIELDQKFLSSNYSCQINANNGPIINPPVTQTKMFITAHNLPIINLWAFKKKGLKHISTLRGRFSRINCFLLDSSMAIILAGHIDGYISVFSTNPCIFIREIKGRSEAPIYMLKLVRTKGNIICFQRDEKSSLTIITMWSINGQLLGELKILDIIKDCIVSAFAEGTIRNVIVFLNNNAELLVIEERSFGSSSNDPHNFLVRYNLPSNEFNSLQLWRNIIFGIKKDLCYPLFSLDVTK